MLQDVNAAGIVTNVTAGTSWRAYVKSMKQRVVRAHRTSHTGEVTAQGRVTWEAPVRTEPHPTCAHPSVLDRMHIGSVADWDVFRSMVFWCTYPGSIFNSNNLVYRSACPSGTLALPIDIPRVYSTGYSYCNLGMAWKNVASGDTVELWVARGQGRQ